MKALACTFKLLTNVESLSEGRWKSLEQFSALCLVVPVSVVVTVNSGCNHCLGEDLGLYNMTNAV